MGCTSSITLVLLLLVDILTLRMASGQHDYRDALAKSILFFEGQRSGKLPSSQRMKWRKDSALNDVLNKGNYKVDLVGGYYDAGDNLKFNFPMAFSTTMLAWSVLEFGSFMGSELEHANEAVRWGTDYLLKSTSIRDVVFVQVGEPYADHFCWERPEDMDTPRNIYAVSKKYPGSEVAGETAAALASSSIIFRSSDPSYSQMILERAMQVFEFADKYQGSYSESLGSRVCPFYCDFSGYKDELLWAAAWIYKASNNSYYWDYIMKAIPTANEDPLSIEFGWDNKGAGTNVLITNDLLAKKDASSLTIFRSNADTFICSVLPESPFKKVQYSPGGLLFKPGGSNMQNPSALSFLILAYSQYLSRTNNVVNCGGTIANAKRLVTLAKSQVDYILGNNPLKMSYMVGYGKTFPLKIHHRGSSLPSIDQHPQHISCKGGSPYYLSNDPNPNQLTGAVVGGPFPNDTYPDSRFEFRQSEPTTYINAPLVGVLAYFTSH